MGSYLGGSCNAPGKKRRQAAGVWWEWSWAETMPVSSRHFGKGPAGLVDGLEAGETKRKGWNQVDPFPPRTHSMCTFDDLWASRAGAFVWASPLLGTLSPELMCVALFFEVPSQKPPSWRPLRLAETARSAPVILYSLSFFLALQCPSGMPMSISVPLILFSPWTESPDGM